MSEAKTNPMPEELPCDFLAFLEQRLELTPSAATEQLGDWLASYEPGPTARAMSRAPGSKTQTKRVARRAATTTPAEAAAA